MESSGCGHHRWAAGPGAVGADLLRRVRRTPEKARPGQDHRGVAERGLHGLSGGVPDHAWHAEIHRLASCAEDCALASFGNGESRPRIWGGAWARVTGQLPSRALRMAVYASASGTVWASSDQRSLISRLPLSIVRRLIVRRTGMPTSHTKKSAEPGYRAPRHEGTQSAPRRSGSVLERFPAGLVPRSTRSQRPTASKSRRHRQRCSGR